MKVAKQALMTRALRLALGVGMLLGHGAWAQQVQRVDITEFGIYKANVDKSVVAPGSVTGVAHTLSDIELEKSTMTVTARLGERFGFRYRIVGHGKSVTLKRVIHFPEPGLHNPDTEESILTSKVVFERAIGEVHFFGYSLDHDWEIVPGTWIFELWINDRNVATKSFELVRE
jgi:hypothetical protein